MSEEIAVVETNKTLAANATTEKKPFDPLDHVSIEDKTVMAFLIKGGMTGGEKDAYKNFAKVEIGKSMGLSLQESVRGIIIQNGMPSFSANIMATAIKKSGKYDYSVEILEDKVIFTVEKKRDGKWVPAGKVEFGKKEATTAGLSSKDTFKKYPQNMWFARGISNVCKWICPDVFNNNTPYTPDEIPDSDVIVNPETLEIVGTKSGKVTPTAIKDEEVDYLVEINSLLEDTKSQHGLYLSHFKVNDFKELDIKQQKQLVKMLTDKLKTQKL